MFSECDRRLSLARNLWILFGVWLAVIAGVFLFIFWHDITPSGRLAERQTLNTVANGNLQTALETLNLNPDQLSVLVFIHPECPCTPASLRTLSRLVDECTADFDLQILVASYGDTNSLQSTNARLAEAIPKATVQPDPNGTIAQSLDAHVSGTICVVAPNNNLLYLGGLTNSRGCETIGPHFQIIKQVIQNRWSAAVTTSVYGCDL